MKDYADKGWLLDQPSSTEEKLGRAIGYLMARGICRGKPDCNHVYRNADGKRVTPILRYSRDDGLPF